MPDLFDIHSRRFFGNKYKLSDFLSKNIRSVLSEKDFSSFADIFAGTGSVANIFSDKRLVVNDLLLSNHIVHKTFFESSASVRDDLMVSLIQKYNSIPTGWEDNYMSVTFGGSFFSSSVAGKIGKIREEIEIDTLSCSLNDREKSYLLSSLVYATDKIAKTFGHYDAFRKTLEDFPSDILLKPFLLPSKLDIRNKCLNSDANSIANDIDTDVVYLDPPYNSRQYGDAYHLLENLVAWQKPGVFGVAKKMNRDHLKSKYSGKDAESAFSDLINDLAPNTKVIVLSYNNTEKKSTARSNALLSDSVINEVFSNVGDLQIVSAKHKAFTTGRSFNPNNEERLFICKIK